MNEEYDAIGKIRKFEAVLPTPSSLGFQPAALPCVGIPATTYFSTEKTNNFTQTAIGVSTLAYRCSAAAAYCCTHLWPPALVTDEGV